jgi:hypothetical protein
MEIMKSQLEFLKDSIETLKPTIVKRVREETIQLIMEKQELHVRLPDILLPKVFIIYCADHLFRTKKRIIRRLKE